ncbi:MAG: cell division protein ZapB [Bermanella sp.]
MELLDKLEAKITLALETVELLNMENDELKQEIAGLNLQNASLNEQKNSWENKLNGMLSQFETQVAELQSESSAA